MGLPQLFDIAWARQPEAQALPAWREAAQAQQAAARAWTPEPPALQASHRTDRLGRDTGAREQEFGLALPLWLPGERRGSGALAAAEATAVESRAAAARLRLAATVREAWWAGQRAVIDRDIARAQQHSAAGLADDVARRVRAGELSRADQHQAEAALAAAQASLAQAEAALAAALQPLQALNGGPLNLAPAEPARAEPEPPPQPAASSAIPAPGEAAAHPALQALQDRAAVAEQAAALAATRVRAHPELTLATTRERGAAGERAGSSLTLALRIPLGAGPRHTARLAAARAEAAEAQAQLALDRARLQSEGEAAAARVAAARAQLAAVERRATLAQATRGFFEKSFRLGETDLPTRLRIEAEASEAERQAARGRIELAAALSAWRQALGLLPQ